MSSLRDSRGQSIANYVNAFPLAQLLTTYGIEYEMDWEELAVPALSSVYAVWEVPAAKYAALFTRLVQVDEGRANYRAFTSFIDGTEGDEIPVINLRLDSTINTDSRFVKMTGPTAIDPASKIVDIPLIGVSGGFFTPAQGDLSSETSYRLYPPGTRILIELENQETSTIYFKVLLKWWELSPRAVPQPRDF